VQQTAVSSGMSKGHISLHKKVSIFLHKRAMVLMEKRCVIIGGGLHGVHMAHRLSRALGWSAREMLIVDPAPAPLSRWRTIASRIGLQRLRSTRAHHLGWHVHELKECELALLRSGGHVGEHGAAPYHQPSWELFDAHASHIVDVSDVRESWCRGRVSGMWREGGHWVVEWQDGQCRAMHVILAIGRTEWAHWPAWARTLQQDGASIQHVFASIEAPWQVGEAQRVAVVGRGMSALQLAMALVSQGKDVQLIARGPVQESWFDADPGWVGPRRMRTFWEEPDLAARRAMIVDARETGTVPPPLARAFQECLATSPLLSMQEGNVLAAHAKHGQSLLSLDSGVCVKADAVLLATGTTSARPGGTWLDQVIAREQLSVAGCGFPVPDESCRWSDGLYVMGALAELFLGPTAPNIIGARMAAIRIVRSIQEQMGQDASSSSLYGW
jgi:thioredoxin reductase